MNNNYIKNEHNNYIIETQLTKKLITLLDPIQQTTQKIIIYINDDKNNIIPNIFRIKKIKLKLLITRIITWEQKKILIIKYNTILK